MKIEQFVYVIGFVSLLFSVFIAPKSKENHELNGVVWIVFSYLLLELTISLLAALLNILNLKVNLFSIGISLLLLSGVTIVYLLRKKIYQRYSYEIIDLVLILSSLICILIFFFYRFTPGFLLNFETSDPSIHYQAARNIINTGRIDSMYFNSLYNALNISLLSPFVTVFDQYKLFIISDMFGFWISVLTFWGSIRLFLRNKFLLLVGVIFTMLYSLGYPLTNHLFGFGYLGWGVTILVFLFAISLHFEKGLIEFKIALPIISMICFGIVITYILFAPVTFASVALFISLNLARNYRVKPIRILGLLTLLFIVGILGGYYIFLTIFEGNINRIFSSINIEGYINRDLFSDFVMYIPLVLFNFLSIENLKSISFKNIFAIFEIIYVFVLLLLGLNGFVSSYYYYKNYYLLWFVTFFIAISSMDQLDYNARKFVASYTIILTILPILMFIKVDEKIYYKNILFSPQIATRSFSNIYFFNQLVSSDSPMFSEIQIEFMRNVKSLMSKNEAEISIISDWMTSYWFYGMTDQSQSRDYVWITDVNSFIQNQKQIGRKFLAITYGCTEYLENKLYFDGQTKIYDDSVGFVYKLQ